MYEKSLPKILWPHSSLYPLFCNKAAWSKERKNKQRYCCTLTQPVPEPQRSCYQRLTDYPRSRALYFSLIIPGHKAGSHIKLHTNCLLRRKRRSGGRDHGLPCSFPQATMSQQRPSLTFRALGQHCSERWSTVRKVGLEGKLCLRVRMEVA